MPQTPFVKCFCLFTCTSGLIEDKIYRIFFVVVDLLSLKLLIFRYAQNAPDCTFFPGPRSTSVIPHPYRAACAPSLVNSLIFIKTLKDTDQIVRRL